MSSLAKQLQKLAIPGQPSLRQVISKKRPSLLFDRDVAADIDIDSIHSLGINGLEELISIDQSFEQFESTLFQDSCKDFERTVQTKEILEEIDNIIATFLQKLSPYFLLKPAQKCLEWLIRSFRINSFNVDSLMECILPYHETNLFARVLQLLPIKDPTSSWHWLRPSQKAGSPLSKLTIKQHCISVPSFLVFLCEMVNKSLKTLRTSSSTTNHPLLGLYTSTVLAVMEDTGTITEELLSRLLPYLVKGLKSLNADYRAGTYMVVSQLAARSTLDTSLCHSLLEVIAKHLGPELLTEGVSSIAVICHTQQIKTLTKRAVRHLGQCHSLVPVLAELSQSYYIAPFLSSLLTSLLASHCEGLHGDGDHDNGYLTMIIGILDSIRLEEETVSDFLKALFEWFLEVKGQDVLTEETVRLSVAPLVQSMDAKYPVIMDRAIEGALAATDDSAHSGGVVHLTSLLTTSLPRSRHQVMTDLGSTLALSVHHSNPALRAAAVREMGQSLKNSAKTSPGVDGDFLSSSLLARLRDDDPSVVAAVLAIDTQDLFAILPASQLVPSLLYHLRRRRLHKLPPTVQENALSALSKLLSPSMMDCHALQLVDDVIATVIPLLFTGRHSNLLAGKVGEVIVQSAMSGVHHVLKGLMDIFSEEVWRVAVVDTDRDPAVLAAACEAVFDRIGRQIVTMGTDEAHNLLTTLLSTLATASPDQPAYFALLSVLGSAVSHMTCDDIITQLHLVWYLLDMTRDQLSCVPEGVSVKVCGLSESLQPLMWKHPSKNRSHGNMLLWVLNIITEHLLTPDNLSTAMWLEVPCKCCKVEDLYHHVLLSLFSLITSCVEGVVSEAARPLLTKLNQRQFGQSGSLMRFLAMIWTTPTFGTEPDHLSTLHSDRFRFRKLPHSNVQFHVTPILQARALAVAAAYVRSLGGGAAHLLGSLCPIVPSLLFPLMSPIKALRSSAVSCLSLLNSTQTTIPGEPLPFLCNLFCGSELKLTSDPTSLVDLFGQLPIEEKSAKSKRRQLRKSVKNDERALGLACVEGVLGHVVMFGMPRHIQVVLLNVLAGLDHQVKLAACTSLLTEMFNKKDSTVYDTDLLQLCVSSYSPKMAATLSSDSEPFAILLSLVMTEGEAGTQNMAIQQITPEFFSSLPEAGLKQSLLSTLVATLVSCNKSSTASLAKQQLRKLPLTGEMMQTELMLQSEQLGGAKPPPTPSKKARRSKAPVTKTTFSDESVGVPLPWKRVTVILELLQQIAVTTPHLLVPDLFNLLNRCLDRDGDGRQVLEYTQQLLLSALLDVCTRLSKEGGPEGARELLQESQFNVELVVQCVRLSPNPQTHHHALLLLSTAAAIFPGPVLHNIMPIFTFMGASVLHHDDQYSFRVITKTIDSVIPALIQSGPSLLASVSASSRRKSAPPPSVGGVVKEIIQVFVDSLPHVPAHRRLPLLTHLLTSVGVGGVEGQLHTALGLLLEKQVVGEEASAEVDESFPTLLTQHFSPTVQLSALFKLTLYLKQLPQEKPDTASKLRHLSAASAALFNIAAHTEKQLRQFRSTALSFMIALLSGKGFMEKMTPCDSSATAEVVLKLLQTVLGYSLALNKTKSTLPHKEGKYWQGLINKTYTITDKVISLLSPQAFLDIIAQLVAEETVTTGDIQRKALEILNKRLEENKMRFTAEHDPTMLELVDVLVGVACSDHTPPVTRQTALYGVKLLTRRLASKHHEHFVKTARPLLSLLSQPTPREVKSNALLAVGETTSSLGPHSIPLLPSALPLILVSLGKTQDDNAGLLQLSAATALGMIVTALPKFLSSYINDIVTKLCHPSLTCGDNADLTKESATVRQSVAKSVPSRVLLPAYLKCYPAVLQHGKPESVVALLGMLSTTIEHMNKDEVKGHSTVLLNVFTATLDYRATQDDQLPVVAIETVETECVRGFSLLVVKLSEALFRPMFIQLLDWATQTSAPRERLITFYHLADNIAGKLKNLFLLFAGHVIKNITTLLTALHDGREDSLFNAPDEDMEDLELDRASPVTKSCQLLDHILHTLTKCFTYDRRSGFLTKERFDALMQPLVDQVSNTMGGSECYSKRVETNLVPCLSHFAVAAGKDSLWKPLNYQLLLKTKHSKSEIRLSALKVLQETYLSLGEEFMVLLPETVPFLAECMEDECEGVEQLTQRVVATIEQILGEPIQQYF